jgi:hypothetical protein
VVGLALVLVALIPVVGTATSFSADEGAAILEARSLAAGRGWTVAHPLPRADPSGGSYPIELSERGPKGVAPFAKHPLYALLLSGADRVGGVTAMVLLSLAGTVAAAAMAAALAGRLDPALERPTVWTVGLASPLLLDGYLVIAHTLGAALAVTAVVVAARAIERQSLAAAVAVGPLVAIAVLFRNEAVFFALGLAVAAAGFALRGVRKARRPALVVAVSTAAAAVLVHVGEAAWTGHLLGGRGGSVAGSIDNAGHGFVAGRIEAFVVTWLLPSYTARPVTLLALLAMVAAVTVGGVAIRRRRSAAAAGAVAAIGSVVAVVTGPANIVPGLLVAFPVLLAGLLLVSRSTLATATARLAGVTASVFALCVLATQYATGGTGEWGGRYFALGLPVAVPVLLLGLRDRGRALGPGARRGAVAAMAICSLAMATMAVEGLRANHQDKGVLLAAIDRAGVAAEPGGRAVVVTTAVALPRWAWASFDRQRWLLAGPSGLDALTGRLREAGVARFVFVARVRSGDRTRPPAATIVSQTGALGGRWQIFLLQTA